MWGEVKSGLGERTGARGLMKELGKCGVEWGVVERVVGEKGVSMVVGDEVVKWGDEGRVEGGEEVRM